MRKFNKKVPKLDKQIGNFAKKVHNCEENMKKNVRKKTQILQIAQGCYRCTTPVHTLQEL